MCGQVCSCVCVCVLITVRFGLILKYTSPWVWHELLPYSAIIQTRNWMIEFHGGIRRRVCFTINITVVINGSCDFDTFVRILYECFASAQRSYT